MKFESDRQQKRLKNKKRSRNAISFIILFVFLAGIAAALFIITTINRQMSINAASLREFDLNDIPEFADAPYVEINKNTPWFDKEQKSSRQAFEEYSELDLLGRCGSAMANVCPELMPAGERTEIGMIKPSGWHTVRYDDIIEDRYLYNRCHLIAYALTGENANEKNLITGTRYMNVSGMLPFEIRVANYIRETGNHVLYRVTPVFSGNESVARGVIMEAWSVEDRGMGICFNVFCYNVQPGIEIDYSTGESHRK